MELQNQLAEIQALGAKVVGVSVDSVDQSKSLASQLHLGFPLVQDRNHAWGSAFGAFNLPSGMDMGPVDNHSIFIVDAAGHLKWKQLAADSMHVPVADVVSALKQS